MLRSIETTHHLTVRTTSLLRSFLFSSPSPNISSSYSSFTFKTFTTLSKPQSQSHSFLQQQREHASSFITRRFHFASSVKRRVSSSSFPALDWNDAVSCSEVDVDADNVNHDGTIDHDSKPAIPVRAFFFSTRYFFISFFHYFFFVVVLISILNNTNRVNFNFKLFNVFLLCYCH